MGRKVIIIGSGHNGLVASIILAKHGFDVYVVDKLQGPGGMAGTLYIGGVEIPIGAYVVGLIPDEIYLETGIKIEKWYPDPIAIYQIDVDKYIRWWKLPEKRVSEFRSLGLEKSVKKFMNDMHRYHNILKKYLLTTTPPTINDLYNDQEAKELIELTVGQYLKELFPEYLWPMFIFPIYYSEPLFMLAYYNPPSAWYYPKWNNDFGVGALIKALYRKALDHGVKFSFKTGVSEILTNSDHVIGVKLDNGKIVKSDVVLSTVSPVNTFLELLDSSLIDQEYIYRLNKIQNYRLEVTRIAIIFKDKPKLIKPLEGFKGTIYQLPIGEMVVNDNIVISVGMPSIDTLSNYITNLTIDNIKALDTITSRDIERLFSVKGGHLNHIPMIKEYMFGCRPLCGLGYRTPIKGLYLGGSGTWPGGQITGIPGRNSAYTIIHDVKQKSLNI